MVEGKTPEDMPGVLHETFSKTVSEARAVPAGTVGPGYFAPMRVDEFVASRVVEAVVHGIDLTQALGRDPIATPDGIALTAAILDDLLARRTVGARPPQYCGRPGLGPGRVGPGGVQRHAAAPHRVAGRHWPGRRPARGAKTRLCLAGAMTTPSLRDRLFGGEPVYGGWSIIPAVSARALAAAGLDYVGIDLQHGGATEHDLPELTSAIRLAGAAPLGRVRHAHPADIGRALDLGCDGVIVPNVDSAEQASVGRAGRAGSRRTATGPRAACWPPPSAAVHPDGRVAAGDGRPAGDPGRSPAWTGSTSARGTCRWRWAARSTRTTRCCGRPGARLGRLRRGGQAVRGARHGRATARLYRENGCQLVTVAVDGVAVARAAASELAAARG